jgi:hypothetical protein
MKFTVSMACYDDFDGVYFTVQALRAYHDMTDVDLLVLDNHPDSPHGERLRSFAPRAGMRYVPVTDRVSSWVKYDAILHAAGDVVIGMDSHVLLMPGALDALKAWWQAQAPGCRDLLTGPVIYDELQAGSSHLLPEWGKHDFGVWSPVQKRDATREPMEVPMQGMGFWSVWRTAWPGVPTGMAGFGAEEWCLAERIRQHGGRVISHPAVQWGHRFAWPKRTFTVSLEDKVRNYYRGWLSVYRRLDHPQMQAMTAHWQTQMPPEKLQGLIKEVCP